MEPILDIIDLNPGEIRSREHDWADNVVTGTAIAGTVDIVVTELATGADSTLSNLVAKNQSTNVTEFSLRRNSGETGAYSVALQMQRDDGDIFRDFYLLGREGTVYDLIASAYETLNVVRLGDVPSSEQQRFGLRMLNSMLASWSDEPYRVSAMIAENFVLTVNDGEYTIGSGGQFDTIRPKDIASAFIRYGGVDVPLLMVGKDTYDNALALKTLTGTPSFLYYENSFPLAKIYFHPIPDAAYQLWIRGQKELTSYSSLAQAHGLERDYEDAIKWNLAMRKAAVMGLPLQPAVPMSARESLNKLENLRSGDLPSVLDGGQLIV